MIGIVSIHYRAIGKGYPVKVRYSILGMYMPEKMQSGLDCRYATEEFFRAVIDVIVKIKDAQWRSMGNKDICIFWDIGIMSGLAVSDAVAHKHRDTIEFHVVYFHPGIAQIIHIAVKSVNGGTIKAFIVVTANEYLLWIRKVAKPIHKIKSLLLTPVHGKIAGMNNNVCRRQIAQPPVTTVRVGNMQYSHL